MTKGNMPPISVISTPNRSATVHWVLDDATGDGSLDPTSAVAVAEWNTRKGQLFTERHVEIARDALRSRGWLAEPALSS